MNAKNSKITEKFQKNINICEWGYWQDIERIK